MTDTRYTVEADDQGRFLIMDRTGPVAYPMPGLRYGDREEAQERADRYNAIKDGEL